MASVAGAGCVTFETIIPPCSLYTNEIGEPYRFMFFTFHTHLIVLLYTDFVLYMYSLIAGLFWRVTGFVNLKLCCRIYVWVLFNNGDLVFCSCVYLL